MAIRLARARLAARPCAPAAAVWHMQPQRTAVCYFWGTRQRGERRLGRNSVAALIIITIGLSCVATPRLQRSGRAPEGRRCAATFHRFYSLCPVFFSPFPSLSDPLFFIPFTHSKQPYSVGAVLRELGQAHAADDSIAEDYVEEQFADDIRKQRRQLALEGAVGLGIGFETDDVSWGGCSCCAVFEPLSLNTSPP